MGVPGNRRYLLKVFSGPHLGAEALLGEGDCVIGSDDACDVILGDQFIGPRHARLTIGADSADCEALDGSTVLVGGQAVETASLKPFEYFTLGNTHLAYGPADAAWPEISFPDYRLTSAARADRQDSEEETQTPATDSEEANSDGGESAVEFDAAEVAPERKDSWRAAVAVLIAIACLAPLLLIGIVAATWTTPPPARPSEAEVRAALETVVRRHNYTDSVELVDRQGKACVDGYVATSEDRKALLEALGGVLKEKLGRLDYSRLKVWDTERLATAAGEVINMYDAPVTAMAGDPGEVILEGELPSRDGWPRLMGKIREDVPKIRNLTDNTTLVGDSPTLTLATDDAQDPGPGDETQEPTPSTPPEQPELSVAVGGTNTPASLPPYRSINFGNTPSITLIDGLTVYRGATLRNGYTVVEIEESQVTLVRDGKPYVIKVGI